MPTKPKVSADGQTAGRAYQPPSPDLSYLGPLPAMMEKRAGRFRYVLQLDANQRTHLQQLVTQLALQLENHPDGRGLRWSIDIDPQEL